MSEIEKVDSVPMTEKEFYEFKEMTLQLENGDLKIQNLEMQLKMLAANRNHLVSQIFIKTGENPEAYALDVENKCFVRKDVLAARSNAPRIPTPQKKAPEAESD